MEQQSEGEGSLLTSRVSQYSSESAFGSADEAEPAELTMFKSAELYLRASGLDKHQFVAPYGRDKTSSCT